MTEMKLKTCPFCGGKVGVLEYGKTKEKFYFEKMGEQE